MAKTELLGSWFNSGYHGHFRSKSRTDFLCEYRHLSKPVPPGVYIKRSKNPVTKHVFSNHDNRHSFMNDALYFEEGMGRRRLPNSTNRYQQDLLAWHPEREERKKARPTVSVYKVDYHAIPPSETHKQKITQRPKTSFDGHRNTTSYRYAHGGENPNKGTITAMYNDGLSTFNNRKQKASFITGRESVATCLNWYVPKKRSESVTQSLNETAMPCHVPHPPETQKPSTSPAAPTTAPATVTTAEPPAPKSQPVIEAL